MDMGGWLAEEFEVPEQLETPSYRLRKLTLEDAVKDYDAVMTSVDRLQTVFGVDSGWPSPDMSLHYDMVDLGWHQKEFELRRSFAYTVVTLDERVCVGCAYIFPTPREGADAKAYCWVRTSHAHLDDDLFRTFKQWIAEVWPFESVIYPGRGD
ncbi:MAG: GNAT family N-acetyltransferase [Thiotrichales bacterium]|nr:GNAT family N-acetyltransferase [Thiotrichales bacterium]